MCFLTTYKHSQDSINVLCSLEVLYRLLERKTNMEKHAYHLLWQEAELSMRLERLQKIVERSVNEYEYSDTSWFLNVIWVKTTVPLPPLWGFSGSGQVALKFIYFFNKHFIEGLRVSRQVLGANQWGEENDCGPGPREGHATFYCHILVRTWVTGGGKCYTKQLMSKRSEKKTGKGDRSVEGEWGCRGAGRQSVVTTRKSFYQRRINSNCFRRFVFSDDQSNTWLL